MWEEQYKKFLCDIGVMGMQGDVDHDLPENETDDEMRQMKEQNSRLIALVEKTKFIIVLNIIVIISVSILLLCKWCLLFRDKFSVSMEQVYL
jgi:hypothetical protein